MMLDRDHPPRPPETLEDAYKVIVALWQELLRLQEENAQLHARVAELEEKLRTNSSNSSKPPSSDPPGTKQKKAKRRGKRKRRRGGQPGHEGKTRELLPPDEVDHVVSCLPNGRCDCHSRGRVNVDTERPERIQKMELPEVKPIVTEYQIFSGECSDCGRIHRGGLPEGVPPGMLGPRAMATVSVLSGKYHQSKREIEEILEDLFGTKVCLGTVSNTEARVSEALAPPVEEAKAHVQERAVVHADETGHKVAGKKAWVWLAATLWVSVFLIRFSRGAKVAKELLGEEFKGILVSDRWSGYNWVDAAQRQLCWAHLIRDFVKISQRGGKSERIANRLLAYAQEMFELWRLHQEGKRSRRWFRKKMKKIRSGIERQLVQGSRCGHPNTERTCKRVLKVKVALWAFVDTPGIEPTNNFAERTIRPYVLWRKSSFGTQSERGNLFVERMLTVSATCKQQGRNVLDYVTAVVRAHQHGEAAPSLLPDQSLMETQAVA